MSKLHSTPTAVLTAIALAASIGFAVQYLSVKRETARAAAPAVGGTESSSAIKTSSVTPRAAGTWAASAPGRIEPRKGETRIGAQSAGRVAEVLVQANDKVVAGDTLLRIDDEEAQAKLAAADAEAAVRKRERDAETVGKLAQDRRTGEDAQAAADRGLFQSRRDLDRAIAARIAGGSVDEVVKARAAVTAAKDKLEQERQALKRIVASSGMPLPTRQELALATARAEILLAETAIERARVRAPVDGTILQVNSKIGETVAPSPELALVVMGDLTGLRVRAEVEERDVSKVKVGQKVTLRSDAFPGREFTGVVATLAQSLAAPRLPSRGPRRPTDVDTLEVLIDVDGQTPLLPGMRADVFFEQLPGAAAAPAAAAPAPSN